jgi:hypothetical protein
VSFQYEKAEQKTDAERESEALKAKSSTHRTNTFDGDSRDAKNNSITGYCHYC